MCVLLVGGIGLNLGYTIYATTFLLGEIYQTSTGITNNRTMCVGFEVQRQTGSCV
jgi:hypothetical protein